ncbi:ARM repeat-containing protein [Thelephora terrestris]|uniref:ARM repeat-containing protein n=1 Tax=Thelephora terrestris TaxID=56493 RepID=A0A9P6H9Q3_9AGAM|nr:ARM repeat-containing protein [Thelephora terrestris]
MESTIAKQLVDKMYEKRKAAALDLEKLTRECNQQGDHKRISQIVDQLVEMFSNASNHLHARNGGLIGLAGTAIALGVGIAPYMDKFVDPLLNCFTDVENRVRYFSAECLYNIAKVSKGEILVYFNPIFDALSKLAADSELSVKNGAEMLDRLLKDIVAEMASVYVPLYQETWEKARDLHGESPGIVVPHPDDIGSGADVNEARKAFSLKGFIPLLADRIYVISPFTRSFLVSWISVLDSVPELELVTYLPEFLDGLLKYLSDPSEDVRVATEVVLSEFLKEIRVITAVARKTHGELAPKQEVAIEEVEPSGESQGDTTPIHSEEDDGDVNYPDGSNTDFDDRDLGSWIPGQGVKIDYAAIAEILIHQLDGDHDEIQQSTALRWLSEFLTFAHEIMVPFTPRLILAILPNLAHDVHMIQSAAVKTNKLLLQVVQSLPSPTQSTPDPSSGRANPASSSPTPTAGSVPTRHSSKDQVNPPIRDLNSPELIQESTSGQGQKSKGPGATPTQKDIDNAAGYLKQQGESSLPVLASRPESPVSMRSGGIALPSIRQPQQQSATTVTQGSPITDNVYLMDYPATVNALTIQFLSEHEETRVAALRWLIMLHQKSPKACSFEILGMDDGTFPALLKTLSDSSEEVIKHDLQLIAQISTSSEESYFRAFMHNLLELFGTDRRLLETRGSLIIRQLCLNLNTEKIYRTFAELLEREEDLEFAGIIVQKLSLILMTSPELAEFRRRLKSLETRQDGQVLFTILYKSWCHNPVAVFSLCLLAQAYEHASNLLYIFADLEVTVALLVQIDKLVQLIESPVFTYLRLQLLEPEKYPYLFKCLYGLLMLLPQSSAFVSLRNRLNAVNSSGFLHIAPKSTVGNISSTRSKLGRDDIKWQELLQHFRSVQAKHEKARRQSLGADLSPLSELLANDRDNTSPGSSQAGPPGFGAGKNLGGGGLGRRKTIAPPGGGGLPEAGGMRPPSRSGVLSPLNPRSRQNGLLSGGGPAPPQPPASGIAQKPKRSLSLVKK